MFARHTVEEVSFNSRSSPLSEKGVRYLIIPDNLKGFLPTAIPVGSEQKLIIPVIGRDIFLANGSERIVLDDSKIDEFRCYQKDTVHLGQLQGVDCEAWSLSSKASSVEGFSLSGLRALLFGHLEADFGLAGRAVQLLEWKQNHRYCGRCGERTEYGIGDHSLICKPCNISSYPRIAPCIITVITKAESCLLARNKHWPEGVYSALAGFVEPGESVEQALHREVFEESGVKITNEQYFGSQPWPFPGQLMLGFHAEHLSGDIVVDDDEIEDAHWWRFDNLPKVPSSASLSGQLIAKFKQDAEFKYGRR